jgi:dihydrofolate synthase / folylpolyglutamate synthase
LSRSLEQWLAHQAQVHPQSIDLGLERLRQVLDRLHWQQPSVPVITVAGTNGKGSVTAYCTAMLGAAGYRVGTFTSPHLRDYRERIRIDDRLVTNDELVWAFERIEAARMGTVRMGAARMGTDPMGIARADTAPAMPAVTTPGEVTPREGSPRVAAPAEGSPRELSLTFFEYNALAAFLIFEAAKVDAWVLEVGLGGRLDAVNVVDPTVAVVVSIGLDHQEFLGTTLEAIAVEKAGIFRRGRAAVLGSRESPAALVDVAESVGATLKRLGTEFDYLREAAGWHYTGNRWDLPNLPSPALVGAIQFANAATAVAVIEELQPRLPVSPAALAQGLESVRLVGRFQIIPPIAGKPAWILDVAHNPDAARVLARNLRELPSAGRTLAVCGILADKDAAGIAGALRECFDAWWLASTEGARGTSAADLADRIAGEVSRPVAMADDIAAACGAARRAAAPEDRIVVFGSFHTVGPALDWLESQGLLPPTAHPEYT